MTCRILLDASAEETLTVGEELAWQLGAQLHEIATPEPAPGRRAALRRGVSTLLTRKRAPDLFVPDQPWHKSDLMVLGTPALGSHIAPALRHWLETQPRLPARVAFLCTSEEERFPDEVFSEMERLTGRDPVAQLHLSETEIETESWGEKIHHFLDRCVLRHRHSA